MTAQKLLTWYQYFLSLIIIMSLIQRNEMNKQVYETMKEQMVDFTTRKKKGKWKMPSRSKYQDQSVVPKDYKDEFAALE